MVSNQNKTTKLENEQKLMKVTHLYLQDKYLRKIPKIAASKYLTVLYLYNNDIITIENVDHLCGLQSLYLQRNKIETVENLRGLKNLRKLYLGHNNITVLEGLENLEALEELHVEKQLLPDNIMLCLDPRTIMSLSYSLQVLNISHNKIPKLSYLAPLKNLVVLNASYNDLDDIKDVCETIKDWYYLKEATFLGNSFTKKHRYRENIIANTYCLELLDKKEVTNITRTFIKRLEEEKLTSGSRHTINLTDILPTLPKNYPLSLQKAVSASILKTPSTRLLADDLSTFDEKDAVHIAWKALPKAKPLLVKSKFTISKKRGEKKVVINNFPQIAHF